MATEQVINWIGGVSVINGQEPVKLSKTIDSFESDFANGYLFGEILTQYGLCESLNTFSRKTNKEAKVHNFYQVEEVLRFLKVNFDAKLIHQIMNEDRGASLRLLYQLKLSLDKHFSQSDLTVTQLKQRVVDAKVKNVKDLATSLPEIKKQYGVEGPTFKAKHLQLIENKLLKYEVARAGLEKNAYEDDLSEKNMLRSIQQQKRQDAIRKMHENKQFMNEWEAEGKQNWKGNREIRAKEIARQLYFEDREVTIYKDKLTKTLNFHTEDMVAGIDDFHENMQKLGIEQDISIQDAIKRQEEKKGIPPGQIQNFSYAATMNKIKETKTNNEFAGKERERRNRKMKVDQLKIQQTLDAKKREETLIQKLMQKQSQEQDEAYTRWRQEQCKQIILNNRKAKAEDAHAAKIERNIRIEEQMRQDAIDAEEERRAKQATDQVEYKGIRAGEKSRKRHLNIEIASEIVDLIMDVADEAHDFQQEAQSGDVEQNLITKAQWREWMSIFGQGKKVSEQKLLVSQDNVDQVQADTQVKQLDSMAQILTGSTTAPTSPYKLLTDIRGEPIYDDFLQYISMCGPLNLRLVAADKWHSFKDIFQKDQNLAKKGPNVQFLNELFIPKNYDLGKTVANLYSAKPEELLGVTAANMSAEIRSLTNLDQDKQPKVDFPDYHSLKLCLLGKAQSGKKTQAKALLDKLGAENLTVFHMGEIIREALEYVDPSQTKEEVVDPKAKGGKAKPAETPVDKFAGKDTTQYKEIANLLLKQVQLTTGNEEALPGKDVDLLSLISDDNLLVQLFIQKLKLAFKAEGQSQEEKEQLMRGRHEREKELLDQLEEAKQNENVEPDPKAKGGKAKAAKTPAEIQEEINVLMAFEVNGWLLVDFPRNLTQAKLLEHTFTGYQSLTDEPKSSERQNYESWSKFTDPDNKTRPGYDGELSALNSLFDAILVVDTPKDECFRRAQRRKQDPTNGTIYHLEDNAPPENDQKLMERLVDYFGSFASEEDMIQKIDLNHMQYSDQEASLGKFFDGFGSFDKPTGNGIQSLFRVSVSLSQKKEETFEQIAQAVQRITAFKQIAQDREYQAVKAKVLAEEEERIRAEAAAAEGEAQDKASAGHVSDKKSADDRRSAQQNDDDLPEDLQRHSSLKKGGDNASKGSLHSHPFSGSKLSFAGSKKNRLKDFTREYKIKLWEEMECDYIRDGMMTISDIKRQRESVINNLNQCQRQFIQFLERPSQKQEKVNEFVVSFNKFSQEFPDLRKDDQTKDELLNRVSLLSNALWDIIVKRKDESLEHIQKMSNGGWSDQEMRQTVRNMASLIEIEIKKFEAVYKIVMESEPPIELDAEILTKKLIDRGIATYDRQTKTSPVFEQVIATLLQKLDDLIQKNPIVQQILNDLQGRTLQREKDIFIYRLALINTWALAILEEIDHNSTQVYELLDDWIVDAVAQENQICQQILQILKDVINSEQLKIEEYQTQLSNLSLFSKIQTVQFNIDDTPLYLRKVHIPIEEVDSNRFDLEHLRQLYIEMRFNTGEGVGSFDTLDQQSYVNMMTLALRQGCMPLTWKYMNFSKISALGQAFSLTPLQGPGQDAISSPQMYQSSRLGMSKGFQSSHQRTWVNWRKLLTFFALLNSPVPSEKELADLRVKLTDLGENQFVTAQQFASIPFWFDQCEGRASPVLEAMWLEERRARREEEDDFDSDEEMDGKPAGRLDADRLLKVKQLLFDIHRVGTGQSLLNVPAFIDALIECSNQADQSKGQTTFAAALWA